MYVCTCLFVCEGLSMLWWMSFCTSSNKSRVNILEDRESTLVRVFNAFQFCFWSLPYLVSLKPFMSQLSKIPHWLLTSIIFKYEHQITFPCCFPLHFVHINAHDFCLHILYRSFAHFSDARGGSKLRKSFLFINL
jgi:hypothetical protein